MTRWLDHTGSMNSISPSTPMIPHRLGLAWTESIGINISLNNLTARCPAQPLNGALISLHIGPFLSAGVYRKLEGVRNVLFRPTSSVAEIGLPEWQPGFLRCLTRRLTNPRSTT